MEFEWDEKKAAQNLEKHGVSFEEVVRFDFRNAHTAKDSRNEYGELRFQTLGAIEGRIHLLVYTRRGSRYRVISLRKANSRERRIYERARTDT